MKRGTVGVTSGGVAGVTSSDGGSRPRTLAGLGGQGSTEVSSAAAERLADWRHSLSDQVQQTTPLLLLLLSRDQPVPKTFYWHILFIK